jgi:mannitol/fructose-specific phosphotransferase system IIA component (Ntr-type)
MTRVSIQDGEQSASGDADVLRVSDLLAPARVRVPLQSQDKEGVLPELVDLVVRSEGLDAERDEIYRAVWERENVLSTGISDGIAVPHAKYNGLDRIVMAAGVSRVPIDFDALDSRPVQLFFLILGPDSAAGSQVRALSRISRLMRDESLREQLVSAGDAERFLRVLGEAERAS